MMDAITTGDTEGARAMMEVRAPRWRAHPLALLAASRAARAQPGPDRASCHTGGTCAPQKARTCAGISRCRSCRMLRLRLPLVISLAPARPLLACACAAGQPQPHIRPLQRRSQCVAPCGAERRPTGAARSRRRHSAQQAASSAAARHAAAGAPPLPHRQRISAAAAPPPPRHDEITPRMTRRTRRLAHAQVVNMVAAAVSEVLSHQKKQDRVLAQVREAQNAPTRAPQLAPPFTSSSNTCMHAWTGKTKHTHI